MRHTSFTRRMRAMRAFVPPWYVCHRYFDANLRLLNEDGRLVIIGLMGGAKAKDAALARVMTRRLTVTGSTLRPQSDSTKATIASELRERAWPLLESGEVGVVVDSVFALQEAAAAHARMESSEHVGKILLDMSAVHR